MNLLLWKAKLGPYNNLTGKLEVFLTQKVRKILRMSMYQIKKERITNNQGRLSTFYTLTTTIIHWESYEILTHFDLQN
jgi:hypothetical protein